MRLDHVGIAVESAEKAREFFEKALGLEFTGYEVVADMRIRVGKVRARNVMLELLEPMEGEQVISKFLKKNGEGIHHICFEVDDIEKSVESVKARGFKPVYDTYRLGVGKSKVNFMNPKETHGILIEFKQIM